MDDVGIILWPDPELPNYPPFVQNVSIVRSKARDGRVVTLAEMEKKDRATPFRSPMDGHFCNLIWCNYM